MRTRLDSARASERDVRNGTLFLPTRMHTGQDGSGYSTTFLPVGVDRHRLPAKFVLSYAAADDCMGRRLEQEQGADVPAGDGTNSPVIILSSTFAHTAIHSKDLNFCSVNELVLGHTKIWWIVPRKSQFSFTDKHVNSRD